MLHYDSRLKSNSRQLRRSLTDSEALIWFKLRRKQILGVQFYRQKPIGDYIVDFYAPKVRLVVELDGSQHFLPKQQAYDSKRELYLKAQGLTVIRFHNLQVLQETRGVLEVIYRIVCERL
jgi:very-short-patch-repair endonuclease